MKHLFIALVLISVVASCKKNSSKVNQDKIYQTYKVSYNEETNQTTFTARFNEESKDGKDLELSDESTIMMNGAAMDKSGASYTKTFNGLVSSGTFVFTDSNGKSYTNTINMCSFISNSGQSDLYTNSAEYWMFGGNEIGQNETVSVSIKNVADNTKTASASSSTVGAYYLTLTTSAMTNLPTGDASAVTTRTKVTNTGNFTSAGGRFEASYLSAKSILYVY